MVTFNTLKLDDHRKALGLSKTELCLRVGIHPTTYSRLLSGESVSPQTVRRIAEHLGVPMESIATVEEDEQQQSVA